MRLEAICARLKRPPYVPGRSEGMRFIPHRRTFAALGDLYQLFHWLSFPRGE